ncbi:hypothetical protein [Burkholderia ubonensis]|uniref:hypothetical protein n=1 Tax=Burkholderia ubonensis TaxID=101571 RepID=UPI000AE2BE16|nr:hypothetical protein [Burkholderia ubonensis]
MISSIYFHKSYLIINTAAWLIFISLFWLFSKDYAIDYSFGGIAAMAGVALFCHFSKRHQERVDAILYYPKFLLISASVITIFFCAIGLMSKINGGSAAFSFALPTMLGRIGYDYFRKTQFKNKN